MKQANEAFVLDNGTIYAGQIVTDDHPAVARFPEKFTDVPESSAPVGQPPSSEPHGEAAVQPGGDQHPGDGLGAGQLTVTGVGTAPLDQVASGDTSVSSAPAAASDSDASSGSEASGSGGTYTASSDDDSSGSHAASK